MLSPVPLLLAAASVGALHMSAPDHWATLVVLGRTSNWSRSRLVGIGAMTAAGHVAISVLLGFAIVGLGLLFSREASVYITDATGLVMLAGGLLYGLRELGHARKGIHQIGMSNGGRFRNFALLGAALSPDLGILPVFLLAVPAGIGLALDAAIVFAVASVSALLIFLLLGMTGLSRVLQRFPPEYNDSLVGFVIAAVGVYVLVATL